MCRVRAGAGARTVAVSATAVRPGRATCAEITLDDAAQLAAWPVAQLKALLVDYGLRCRTCFEKDDYRAFILEHVLRAATGRDEL